MYQVSFYQVIKDSVFRMDMAVWNKTFFEAFAYYNPLFMMVFGSLQKLIF